jgi:hypothetical protein
VLATVAYVRTHNYAEASKALEAQLYDGLGERIILIRFPTSRQVSMCVSARRDEYLCT